MLRILTVSACAMVAVLLFSSDASACGKRRATAAVATADCCGTAYGGYASAYGGGAPGYSYAPTAGYGSAYSGYAPTAGYAPGYGYGGYAPGYGYGGGY